jgi:hypothetical protein
MTDSDIEAKLEALERELEQARSNKDDPYRCAPIYRRVGNIGVPATELLFRLLEVHPEAAYVIRQLRNIAERAYWLSSTTRPHLAPRPVSTTRRVSATI